jgi:outer membrane protein OmpA-like peptidoglycan-associated protein
MSRLVVLSLVTALAVPLSAQVSLPPAEPDTDQATAAAAQSDFRVSAIARTAVAIDYRPRSGDTRVDMLGTTLLPNAKGVATVSGEKGYFVIDTRVHKMEPATKFGSEYLTYVLWAITPEGSVRNLGEVQIDGEDARVEATTELQAFALVVTAEPYYAVTQPSDTAVLENAVGTGTKGSIETIPAKYMSLTRGTYVASAGSGFNAQRLEPDAPLELAEARNAVELARIAGADRYAADTYEKAARLLAEADAARAQRKAAHQVMMPARQAVQTAEEARVAAVRRSSEGLVERQRVDAGQRDEAAPDRAPEQPERLVRAEREPRAATVARSADERERRELEQAKQEAEEARAEAERAREAAEVGQRVAKEEARQARLQALQAQTTAAVAEQEKHTLRERLREQLNIILETRETARGLIMNVPDVLFRTASATLTPVAREKLARVGGILGAHPDLRIVVEGHTDDVGDDQYNQELSEKRAQSVFVYLVLQKIPLTAVDTAGFGETRPVASNDTPEGRRQNRRIEVVVTGDSIGRSDIAGNPAP